VIRKVREGLAQRWLDMSVRAKGIVVVSVPLIALLLIVVMALTLQLREREARSSAVRATAMVTATQDSLVAALNAETSVRAYAVGGDPAFLTPYTTASQGLPATLSALDRAAAADDRQAAGVRVHSGVMEEFALLGRIRQAVERGRPAAKLPPVLFAGKQTMDRLRATVGQISADATAQVRRQRDQINSIESQAEAVDITGLVLGLLGGLAGISLFTSGISRRLAGAVRNARLLGDGQPLEPRPSARDEVGQLAVAHAQTEQVLAERTDDLMVARDEAVSASQAKTRFLSRTSHELRTPLNAVLGFAQLLEFSDLSAEDRDSVAHILVAGRHLVALINDVLDISRIEHVILAPVVADTIALMTPLANKRQITLTPESDDTNLAAHVDRQRFRQILLNLISNAIKYNRDNGTVLVTWGASADGEVELAVSDTGPGMTSAQLERVFVPFDRLGAESTAIEGAGIGLALTKALIEAMGGTLKVESTPGEGSAFTVVLPRSTVPDPPSDAPLEAARHRPPQRDGLESRVVYIEDNVANVQVIERLLTDRPNTRLHVAMTGQLGIDLARQHDPTVILLDLHLADMGGDIVLQRLRSDPTTAAIPVVVLSADASESSIRRLRESGASGYLTKPVDLYKLLELLDQTAVPAPAPGGRTVLYIEDDEHNAVLMERLLMTYEDVEVVVARTGREGLQAASERHPDLIMIDYNLPDMTGDSILDGLRASPGGAPPPVVVLSGDSGRDRVEALLAAGAADFLAKPFDAVDLFAIVDRWLPPRG
jgi:signal transduction histidine kinase/DNA-binding response OmpR family regulator